MYKKNHSPPILSASVVPLQPFLQTATIALTAINISWNFPHSPLKVWKCLSLRVSVRLSWLSVSLIPFLIEMIFWYVNENRILSSLSHMLNKLKSWLWLVTWVSKTNKYVTNLHSNKNKKSITGIWTHFLMVKLLGGTLPTTLLHNMMVVMRPPHNKPHLCSETHQAWMKFWPKMFGLNQA